MAGKPDDADDDSLRRARRAAKRVAPGDESESSASQSDPIPPDGIITDDTITDDTSETLIIGPSNTIIIGEEESSLDPGDRLTGGNGSGQDVQLPATDAAPAIEVIDDDPDEQFGTGRSNDPVAERTFVPPPPEAAPVAGPGATEDEDADEFAFGDGRGAVPAGQTDSSPPPDEGPSPADPTDTAQSDDGFLSTEEHEDDEDDEDDDLD